jgi:hypothetical protein
MCPGSYESRSLLYDISVAGDENLEIFENKLVQKLLEYKFKQSKWLVHYLFFSQLSYLMCVILFAMNSKPEFWMVLGFLILFMFREFIQFFALYKMNEGCSCKILFDYFGFWNILDWVNMFFMIGFLIVYIDLNGDPDEILLRPFFNSF